jgi:hypothetical protein
VLKIAIAIPTYNGLKHLKVLLGALGGLTVNPDIQLVVVVSNIDSSDDTHQFLTALPPLNYVTKIVSNPEYDELGKVKRKGPQANYVQLVNSIPDTVDWVWTLGDDDIITDNATLVRLNEILSSAGDISYINIVSSTRSAKTGQVLKGRLSDFCNRYGWNELFGWISSRISRRESLIASMKNTVLDRAKTYMPVPAYEVEISLYAELWNKMALVIDSGWVRPQEEGQSEASLRRWAEMDRGAGYFTSVDLFFDCLQHGRMHHTTPMFWRYLTFYWWDRLTVTLLSEMLNRYQVSSDILVRWRTIGKIGDMLESPAEKKRFFSWYRLLENDIIEYQNVVNTIEPHKQKLMESARSLQQSVFPWNVLL